MSDRPFSRTTTGDARPITAAGGRPISNRGNSANVFERPETARRGSSSVYQNEGPSRPATSGRPTTARSDRPITARSDRPITARSDRPGSSALRKAPSTASRLISTAAMQRPTTRAGVATGIGLATPISVVDRPITQQGLSGMKTGSRGPQRQVQDKSYYMGLLRTKISELGNEITRLNTETEKMKHEQSSFLTYDKKVKEVAQELTEMQGSLADYNLLVDLINTDTEQVDVIEEMKELKDENDQKMTQLDSLFSLKQERENYMRQIENEMEEERHMGESLVEAMHPELREQYMVLRNENSKYLHHLNEMQQEIDSLDARKQTLEDELSLSTVKREAVELFSVLQDLEEKKNEINLQNQNRGTPKEERERLLNQVKEDNSDIATMDRQMGDIQEEMKRYNEDLQQLEQELDENKSERSQKYRELRKREDAMEQFMESFEQNREEEIRRLEEMESNNVAVLEKIAKNLSHFGNLPNSRDFNLMRSDLSFKKGELEKSQYTEHTLKSEHLNLQANLQKIEALEVKVAKEKVDLKIKMEKMEREFEQFEDIGGLKERMEDRRIQLTAEKDDLEARKNVVTNAAKEIANAKDLIKKQLSENDAHVQLQNLEKKWSILEQANFVMKEFIAQKRGESNFIPIKNIAMKHVSDYNKSLQEQYQA